MASASVSGLAAFSLEVESTGSAPTTSSATGKYLKVFCTNNLLSISIVFSHSRVWAP